MTILTCSTQDYRILTDIQKESCLMCGIEPARHIIVPIDKHYQRPPSWHKIKSLIQHLPHHEYILWMDADSMMVRDINWNALGRVIGAHLGKRFVQLTKDVNGWNCGVMIWKRCPEAFDALWNIYDSFETYKKHPWFEQGAFHVMSEVIGPSEIEKEIYNAYPKDRTKESAILHWPATPLQDTIVAMRAELDQLKGRPL